MACRTPPRAPVHVDAIHGLRYHLPVLVCPLAFRAQKLEFRRTFRSLVCRGKRSLVCTLPGGVQAVVGAGAAGLAAAKELQAEGHTVDVFEQSGSIGGTWVLDERTESDALGQDAHRSRVHSSLYKSLRTNLPRELMSFYDYPFLPEFMKVRCAVQVLSSCS